VRQRWARANRQLGAGWTLEHRANSIYAQAPPQLRLTLPRRRTLRGGKGFKSVKARVAGAAALLLGLSVLAGAPSNAQTVPGSPQASPPPLPGFVPPYEISRIVRSAGFDPLAPPLREGKTYVVRATDFRGILMRVVVDGQSGAIRAVNRIVAGPGPYGQMGMLPPPYGVPSPYGVPPDYAPPPEFGSLEAQPIEEAIEPVEPPPLPAAIRPAAVAHPLVAEPPLPRPRPAELASRDATGAGKPREVPAINSGTKPATSVAAPAAPSNSIKPLPAPPIND
jgi:hypothetical protein